MVKIDKGRLKKTLNLGESRCVRISLSRRDGIVVVFSKVYAILAKRIAYAFQGPSPVGLELSAAVKRMKKTIMIDKLCLAITTVIP